jgi:predicted dehydrogenase
MPTKIALLGSGIFASQFYLPVLLKSAEVDLAALWSRSKTSVDKIASLATGSDDADSRGHSSVKTYFGDDGFEALLADQDVQAVIMALPITAQPPIVLRCLGAGKHVLSEKPVAKDAHTARDLIKRAQTICQSNRVVWRVAESESTTSSSKCSSDLVSLAPREPRLVSGCIC